MSKINDTLKQKIDELDLDTRVNSLVDEAETVVARAVETAGSLAHEHRGTVDGFLDKLVGAIDERTGGKYADQVGKVREQVETGLTKLGDLRADDTVAPTTDPATPVADSAIASGTPAGTDPADPGTGPTFPADAGVDPSTDPGEDTGPRPDPSV